MHEYAPLAITLVAIFAGILMNKADSREIKTDLQEMKTEMNRRFSEVNARFDRLEAKQDHVQADLSEFHRIMGQHDKAIEILEKRK